MARRRQDGDNDDDDTDGANGTSRRQFQRSSPPNATVSFRVGRGGLRGSGVGGDAATDDDETDLPAILAAIQRQEMLEDAMPGSLLPSTVSPSPAAITAAVPRRTPPASSSADFFDELLLFVQQQELHDQMNRFNNSSSSSNNNKPTTPTTPTPPPQPPPNGEETQTSNEDRKPAALPTGVFRQPLARGYFTTKKSGSLSFSETDVEQQQQLLLLYQQQQQQQPSFVRGNINDFEAIEPFPQPVNSVAEVPSPTLPQTDILPWNGSTGSDVNHHSIRPAILVPTAEDNQTKLLREMSGITVDTEIQTTIPPSQPPQPSPPPAVRTDSTTKDNGEVMGQPSESWDSQLQRQKLMLEQYRKQKEEEDLERAIRLSSKETTTSTTIAATALPLSKPSMTLQEWNEIRKSRAPAQEIPPLSLNTRRRHRTMHNTNHTTPINRSTGTPISDNNNNNNGRSTTAIAHQRTSHPQGYETQQSVTMTRDEPVVVPDEYRTGLRFPAPLDDINDEEECGQRFRNRQTRNNSTNNHRPQSNFIENDTSWSWALSTDNNIRTERRAGQHSSTMDGDERAEPCVTTNTLGMHLDEGHHRNEYTTSRISQTNHSSLSSNHRNLPSGNDALSEMDDIYRQPPKYLSSQPRMNEMGNHFCDSTGTRQNSVFLNREIYSPFISHTFDRRRRTMLYGQISENIDWQVLRPRRQRTPLYPVLRTPPKQEFYGNRVGPFTNDTHRTRSTMDDSRRNPLSAPATTSQMRQNRTSTRNCDSARTLPMNMEPRHRLEVTDIAATTATYSNNQDSHRRPLRHQQQQQRPQQLQSTTPTDEPREESRDYYIEGYTETEEAILAGQARLVQCQACESILHIPSRYRLCYCPTCGTVSPCS